jgi:hypothetical protein
MKVASSTEGGRGGGFCPPPAGLILSMNSEG